MHIHHPTTLFFFFNDTATTEIYTLSLHDALPICPWTRSSFNKSWRQAPAAGPVRWTGARARSPSSGSLEASWRTTTDRKSTRLNSSHGYISYAVFCLKKKKILPIVYEICREHIAV